MPPMRAKKPCAYPCCAALVIHPQRYCERHAAKETKRQYETKKQDYIWLLYHTPRFKKFRAWFLRLNVLCMRVVDGRQCMNWATTLHHRRGLRSHPEDLCAAEYCAALCAGHHRAGEDGDRPGDEYVEAETRLGLEMRKP